MQLRSLVALMGPRKRHLLDAGGAKRTLLGVQLPSTELRVANHHNGNAEYYSALFFTTQITQLHLPPSLPVIPTYRMAFSQRLMAPYCAWTSFRSLFINTIQVNDGIGLEEQCEM